MNSWSWDLNRQRFDSVHRVHRSTNRLLKQNFPLAGVVGPHRESEQEEDGESEAAARSLQALVNYHRLYQHWWRNSAPLPASHSRPAAEQTEVNGGGGSSESEVLDFDGSVLLSEIHAAHQETQREVKDVQERLAAIMLQHSRAGAGQAEEGNAPAGEG